MRHKTLRLHDVKLRMNHYLCRKRFYQKIKHRVNARKQCLFFRRIHHYKHVCVIFAHGPEDFLCRSHLKKSVSVVNFGVYACLHYTNAYCVRTHTLCIPRYRGNDTGDFERIGDSLRRRRLFSCGHI